ncbi:adenosylmethionine--8-amino-7-oxononanoate transaminase [Fimbriiglobus ruber]|uniref:Adenosylmethionine-8-amino-7-oxononanoate aminotransferase n=1 Tax=Fimbriiglobus ruber TaxID=1908690 RepID=A0A225D4L1_9BACT|nr:adenosylmethionine--8-amino-7-oxononanoate transaminase [Fimbriiglobus ruber]OWK34584.1 Adenosylmethionine-8-amino-7-oxononanoate aminotransferase [Fimbriiglobus ruber]
MTTDFVVIATDTDAGKTTFSLLWLAAFLDRYEYWKPVETGQSDTETISRMVPAAEVLPPLARFTDPVSPPLAAAREGRRCPTVAEVMAAKPSPIHDGRRLLIETFGSPFSPLNDKELQIELVRKLRLPTVLVVSSTVGAVGRALQALESLGKHAVLPVAVVLVGKSDIYAATEIKKHRDDVEVFSLVPPASWSEEAVRDSAADQRETLTAIESRLGKLVAELVAEDRQVVWHPYGSLRPAIDPLPVVGASGEFIHLADGRRVIDAVSSWWTTLHGHRHPPLMAALREAASRIDHVLFADVTHVEAVKLARRLLRTAPWEGGRVFFSDNGSTAVEVALKMAYQFWCHAHAPHRKLFVGFDGAYHGDTFGAMAVGRDRLFTGTFEPLLFEAARVPLDPNQLDDFLERRGSEVAAVILEPLVQGAGGMLMHSPDTLRAIYEVAKRRGVLFIADEVMTGNRTGRRWAYQHAGIAPDLICAGKTLTGGVLPLAATIAGPGVVAAFDTDDRTKTLFHGHSFTAHPIACAVAAVNEKLVSDQTVHDRATAIGRFLVDRLALLKKRFGVVNIRVQGSIVAVELDAAGGYLASTGDAIKKHAIGRGVLLRPLGNVVYAMPPLCTSDDSLTRIANTIASAIGATAQ